MTKNQLRDGPSLDALMADPAKVAQLPPETARTLLIGLAALQPVLLQRSLTDPPRGHAPEVLLTVPEVAQCLKVSAYRVYELVRQGTLQAVHLGKSVRVTPSAVAEYVAQQGA